MPKFKPLSTRVVLMDTLLAVAMFGTVVWFVLLDNAIGAAFTAFLLGGWVTICRLHGILVHLYYNCPTTPKGPVLCPHCTRPARAIVRIPTFAGDHEGPGMSCDACGWFEPDPVPDDDDDEQEDEDDDR